MATPAQYMELVAAGAGAALWIGLFVSKGPLFAFQIIWILVAALGVGAWTAMRRLRFSRSRLRITFGPWSRAVDLTRVESIHWKEGSVLTSEGTIYVRDRSGHRVPIEVGRFQRGKEWGPLLLQAAAACKAAVDEPSRLILEHGGRVPNGGV